MISNEWIMSTELEDGQWAVQHVQRPHMEVIANTEAIGVGIIERFIEWYWNREMDREVAKEQEMLKALSEIQPILEMAFVNQTEPMIAHPDEVMNHSILDPNHYHMSDDPDPSMGC